MSTDVPSAQIEDWRKLRDRRREHAESFQGWLESFGGESYEEYYEAGYARGYEHALTQVLVDLGVDGKVE